MDPKIFNFIRYEKNLQAKIMTLQYEDYLRKLK